MDIDRSYEYDEDMHIMKCMQTKTHFDQKRSSLKQNKKPIFNTSRLMENLVEVKQTESLSLRDLMIIIPSGPIPTCTIGKELKKIFRNVTIKRKRCKEEWTSKEMTYYGLAFKSTDFKEMDFATISEDYSVTERNSKTIQLGHILKSK